MNKINWGGKVILVFLAVLAVITSLSGAYKLAVNLFTPGIAEAATTCVITLFGKQYDVTSLQSSHSGGNIFACGTDMTTTYQSRHGTNVGMMQQYLITPTPTPTVAPTATPTPTVKPTATPTPTVKPTVTPTPTTVPTVTPTPTAKPTVTPTPLPTVTPVPTITPLPTEPSITPVPPQPDEDEDDDEEEDHEDDDWDDEEDYDDDDRDDESEDEESDNHWYEKYRRILERIRAGKYDQDRRDSDWDD